MEIIIDDELETFKTLNNEYEYYERDILGSGSYGEVYKATKLPEKDLVAVKIIDLKQKKNNPQKLNIEVNILKKMDHENVLKLYDTHTDEKRNKAYIITEFCDGGDFSSIITNTISEEEAKKYIKQ